MVGALALERSLADSYRDEIENSVAQAQVEDALRRLQDFARDFAPDRRHDTLIVSHRYFDLTRRRPRRGLAQKGELDGIISSVLKLASEIHKAATVRPSYSLATSGPSDSPPERPARADDPPPCFEVMDTTQAATTASGPISITGRPHRSNATAGRSPPSDDESADTEDLESLTSLKRTYWRRFGASRPHDQSIACTAEGISKKYHGSPFELEDINFTLRAGEITGLVGRNGSGKTTLLRMVLGEFAPDRGRLTYPMLTVGDSSWAHIKSQIAYVPQMPERWGGRLRENLNFVASISGHRHDVKSQVDWHLQRYGLLEFENHRWGQLSGGGRIRFEVVKALVSRPHLLVLDEPLAYLDIIARQQFLMDLETIATSFERPVPIIMTSQHLYEIEAVADQMIILEGGKCKFAGPLETIGDVVPSRMVEIALRSSRKSVKKALDPLGLKSISPTLDGYVLSFPKDVSHHAVLAALQRRFGDGLIAIRDVTNSARSLFGEETNAPTRAPDVIAKR